MKAAFPVIKTIDQFCAATGWPKAEWDGMWYSECLAILALYDLTLDFEFKPTKKQRPPLRRPCVKGCKYCIEVLSRK